MTSQQTALAIPVGQAVQTLDLAPVAARFNILGATGLMLSANEGLRLRAVIVQLSPSPDDNDVYPSPAGHGKLALAKQGLLKVAEAKGIIWSDEHSRRVNDAPPCAACAEKAADQGRTITTCHHNVGFKAVGAWLDPAGQWRRSYATRYWLYDEERAEVERTYRKQLAAKKIGKSELDQKIEDEFNKRLHDRHALAETKAKLRVIREIGVKAAYTPQELKRGFLCVRAEPDITPEEAKRQALASASEIFGGMAGELPARVALLGPDFEGAQELEEDESDSDSLPADDSEATGPWENDPGSAFDDPDATPEAEGSPVPPTLEEVKAECERLWGAAKRAQAAGQIEEMPPRPPQDDSVEKLLAWCEKCRGFLGPLAGVKGGAK